MTEQPNISYIEKLADGDLSFQVELLRIVKEELPIEKKIFMKHFKDKDWNKCAEDVHKLKHKINLMGLTKGYALAASFEDELRLNRSTNFTSFILILEKIETFLKDLTLHKNTVK